MDRKLRLAIRQAMKNEGIGSYTELAHKMGEWAKLSKIAGFVTPHQTSLKRVLEPDPDDDATVTQCSYLHVLRGTVGVLNDTDYEVAFNRADIKLVRIMAQLRSLGSPLQTQVIEAAERALAATLDAHRKQIAEAQRMLLDAPQEEHRAPSHKEKR